MSTTVLRDRIREIALWVGAVLGMLCLLLAALAWIFDVRPLVFRSGSMSPAIEAGALALAREVPADQVEQGDVVSVMDSRGVRVTHRVVSVDTTGEQVALQLKGDANPEADRETYRVDEVHRVIGDVPWLGHVVNAASTPWGLLVCGGFVALLLVTAFGRPRNGGSSTSAGKRAALPALALVATSALLVTDVAPVDTMAAWSDSSRVGTGAMTALTVTPPGNAFCDSGLLEFLSVNWTHNDARNVSYKVVVTRVGTGEVVVDYPWQNPPAVGQQMSQTIRATGSPSVPTNGNYWATVHPRIAEAQGGWTTTSQRVAINRFLGLMYCGHR